MPPVRGSYRPCCFVFLQCVNLLHSYGMCKTLLQLTVNWKKKSSVITENAIINIIINMREQSIYWEYWSSCEVIRIYIKLTSNFTEVWCCQSQVCNESESHLPRFAEKSERFIFNLIWFLFAFLCQSWFIFSTASNAHNPFFFFFFLKKGTF